MITDRLDHCGTYEKLGIEWVKAFAFLKKCQGAFPAPGRYEIDGNRVYASVQEYTSSPAEERTWEAHRKYADIQCLFDGNECIGYTPVENMLCPADYREDKDCVLAGAAKDGVMLCMRPGIFTVFFPQDAHKPGCALDTPEKVRKVVVKVLCE